MSSKVREVIMIVNICVGGEVWGTNAIKVQVGWF